MFTHDYPRRFSSGRRHRSTLVSLLLTALFLATLMGGKARTLTAPGKPFSKVAALDQTLENSLTSLRPCWRWVYLNGEWVLMMIPCELEAGAMEPVKMLSASNTPFGEVQKVIYRKRAFRMNTMDIAARTVAFEART